MPEQAIRELEAARSLHSEIAVYYRQFEELKQDAARLTDGLSDEQFNWHRPKKWSIAECIGHLNLTAEEFLVSIDNGIQRGWSDGIRSKGPFAPGPALTGWFIKKSEPPYKRLRTKSPKGLIAPPNQPLAPTIHEFMTLKDKAMELLISGNGLDMGRIRVKCPELTGQIALGNLLIKFTLAQAFALLAVHERRHLWQAWQVRNDPSFPKT